MPWISTFKYSEFWDQLEGNLPTPVPVPMEDEGIFLFKNSKTKVTELRVEAECEPAILGGGSRKWIDQLKFPFLGQPVQVVSVEQLDRERIILLTTPAEAKAYTKDQLRLLQRRTKSNRRHKKRTRRQRLLKSKK